MMASAWWSYSCCLLLGAAITSSTTPTTKAFLINKNTLFLPKNLNQRNPNVKNAAQILLRASSDNPSINPNDMETPEERQRRMDLVRTLQKSFYQEEEGITKRSDGILEHVPLWRVQWTELPGYQNILNCHVPHYTHMFMKIINGPKPWYFGHVYLPNGSENLDKEEYKLCEENSKAAHVGTLMKVSDYKQLEEDGRLVIIAQALGKFRIVEATQHLPYAVGTVELVPDCELVNRYYDEALELVLGGGGGNEKDEEKEYDATSVCWGAARVGAVTEAMHWESFEYRNVAIEECLENSGIGGGVSPIANFEAMQIPIDKCDVTNAMKEFLSDSSSSRTNAVATRPDNILPSNEELKQVLKLEREVWIGVDFMIQLLAAVNNDPNLHIPVPTQLLGLLPSTDEKDWPKGFQLHTYVTRLLDEKASIGTMSKSPFVVVNNVAPSYPELRRAQRLSFVIWCLMDSILARYIPAAQTRQSVLELESISERLEAAKRRLDAINTLLRKAIEQR